MEDKKSIRLCMPQLEAIDDMIFTCVVAIELMNLQLVWMVVSHGMVWYGYHGNHVCFHGILKMMVWFGTIPWFGNHGIPHFFEPPIWCNLPVASTITKARLLLKAQEKKNNGEAFLCNNKDGVPLEVQGKWHCSATIDVNIGANPSATYMGEDQGIEDSTNKVVYIIDSLNIQEQLSSEIRSLLGIKKYIQNSATKFDAKKQEISKKIE
ncbi:hypothetical protein FXO37_21759 [Capsicum annuum]|nr:hypothetical protein FXO37_21759 [Capsicum annuum]